MSTQTGVHAKIRFVVVITHKFIYHIIIITFYFFVDKLKSDYEIAYEEETC